MAKVPMISGGGSSTYSSGNVNSSMAGSYCDEIIGTIKINGTLYTKYKRTVYCGALKNNDTTSVDSGITDISKILALGGNFRKPSSPDYVMNIPYIDNTSTNTVAMYMQGSNIVIKTYGNRTSFIAFATIEYYS